MNASILNAGDYQSRLKVSITTRLLAVLSYIMPVIGGALSSFLLVRVFQAMKAAENAGIAAFMTGVNEASLPSIISFYVAAFFGLVLIIVLAVRMMSETETASPPIWFFILGGVLCLVPAALFWIGKWMVIEVLSPGSSIGANGIADVGANVASLMILSIISAPIVFIILVVACVLPLSSRSKSNGLSLAGAALIEILLITVAVAVPSLINEPK